MLFFKSKSYSIAEWSCIMSVLMVKATVAILILLFEFICSSSGLGEEIVPQFDLWWVLGQQVTQVSLQKRNELLVLFMTLYLYRNVESEQQSRENTNNLKLRLWETFFTLYSLFDL